MHEINLLPWRVWARQRTVRHWQCAALAAAVLGALLMLAGVGQLKQRLTEQLRENTRLDERLAGLDGPLAEAGALRARLEVLVEQRSELESLQRQRLAAGELLAGLARAVPAYVRLDSVRLTDDELRLSGVARSGAEVAQFLRALGQAPGMGPADLRDAASVDAGERFQITVDLRSTDLPEAA